MITFIVNDAPYGIERTWNALRLATALLNINQEVSIFLQGDAVLAAKKGQEVPRGYYNMGQVLANAIARNADVYA
ncbi:MAG: hypothetical protein COT35_11130 [Nitrospirae bacterium CG08_land_8_20_14_0_20_52_24]|nr:MAG: hypothetical protein COT35_11130 [Nitrospirae bacterium CG08_land_8_20_14_0_20_52_24]